MKHAFFPVFPVLPGAFWSRLSVVALLAAVPACDFAEVDGNGQRVEEMRKTSEFSRLDNAGALDVRIVQGDEQSVVVSIDENLQEVVTTHVVDGKLRIDTTKDIGEVVPGPHVLVT